MSYRQKKVRGFINLIIALSVITAGVIRISKDHGWAGWVIIVAILWVLFRRTR